MKTKAKNTSQFDTSSRGGAIIHPTNPPIVFPKNTRVLASKTLYKKIKIINRSSQVKV